MDLSKVPKEVLDRIPLQPPPPGVVSNFEHPVSRAAEVQITTYVFLPLMVIFVLLRLYRGVLGTHPLLLGTHPYQNGVIEISLRKLILL